MVSASSSLILVPTAFEAEQLRPTQNLDIELCGFGLAIAGARSCQLIQKYRPRRVVLVGIAGSLSADCTVGKAYRFSHVLCHGIGIGGGTAHQSAASLGWNQLDGDENCGLIGDRLSIEATPPDCAPFLDIPRDLLSVTSASINESETRNKLQMFPNACAEDMEGFAVAAACQLLRIPLTILRGISNVAGDRDKEHWRVKEAMASASALLQELLANEA